MPRLAGPQLPGSDGLQEVRHSLVYVLPAQNQEMLQGIGSPGMTCWCF